MPAKYPSNCLLAALIAWALAPQSTRLQLSRNRRGRWHVTWRRGGRRFEFYGRGASSRTYLRNLHYLGEVREVKS